MNQRQAFKETIELATARNMPLWYDSEVGLAHIKGMYERITDDFSEAKLGRWLGWAQCAVVAAECATLDEMKAINKRWSEL
jgi:hypothetical protein